MLSSSERKRIREVRRYYKRSPDDPPIASENAPAESPETVRSVEKASSPNNTLTALMQLITWRLGAGRAMVSVVDDNAQYFLAEATKTLDLSDSSKHDPGDNLWMGCGGTIRSQALCAYTIEVVPEPNHYACFSVPDLLADPRFCNLPYVAEGPKFRYYAGTPLISNTGIPIGSVFVIDPRPREPATRAEIDFLGLMAKSVMEYLEMKRESVQLRRYDVMSKGLAALVEGQSRIPRQVMTDIIVNCQEVNGTHLDESDMINNNLTSSLVVDTSLITVAEESLNNIELRSPLHGILGSAELMSETNLDNGQFELCSTIETCGRVLQETLMDVLEISKLNNLMRNKGTVGKAPYTNGDTSPSQQSNSENITRCDIVSLPLDLARMCEDSVAIVAAAYMHHSTTSDHLFYRVIQPPGATNRQEGQILYKSSSVTVSLHITFDDWHYFCSPGSIQRIIMNLVAFSQESSLAPGTGLGLHIVDSLVRMYNRTIDVQSQIGHGTTVTVKLPLAKAVSDLSCVAPGKLGPKDQVKEVKDLLKQFQYTTFSTHGFQSGSPGYLKKSLLTYLTQWFEMDHDVENRAPDIAFVTEESLEIFLSNLMRRYTQTLAYHSGSLCPSHGYISQQSSATGIPLETLTVPFGPWKLLKTLLACQSPKQASPSTPPIAEPRILYISPLPSPTHLVLGNIGPNQLVYNGELCGVTKAIEYASSIACSGQKFKIYSDNQAGLYRLKTPSDHPGQAYQIRAIKAAEVIKAKGAEISLNWVPGHTSVEGNELADKLAKEATTIRPISNETSFGLLGMIVKECASDQWLDTLNQYELIKQTPSTYSKLFPWKIGSKIKLPSGTNRNTASAFFQLKLGHGYIKSYLHRFKLANNKCICGNIEAPQTLLISCPIYKAERKEIFKEIPLSKITIQFLLHKSASN
ncbi:hypothetical protein DID88_000153 [Monilinia fructigena]|uniref:ribonuclease H n=1 Tax=Monilinia fructigena TaxID=38457 RepID=A0A395IJA1_9HELO|nr:hypothetical protein DID88_000153 [Monilinia fructigena]